MARQIVDLRTVPEKYGVTRNQQTAQSISEILQTIGQAEQKRRERQTLDRITRAISGGATTVEAIAAAAGQGPQFSAGISGMLQRFGGRFQPSPGAGMQNIQQAIIGAKLQEALRDPLERENLRARTEATKALTEERRRPQPTAIQKLIDEGYTQAEAKEIRDILHGIKPRKTTEKRWSTLPIEEQITKWQTIYQKTLDPAWGKLMPDLKGIQKTALDNLKRLNAEINAPPIDRTQGHLPFEKEGIDSIDRAIKAGGGLDSLPKAGKAPRKELEGIWSKLTDEQKSKVNRALIKGATIDEIKAALRLEGIE